MATWPDSWRENALRASGVPVTQFALDVLSAWRQSTPTEPWTNNPLGMAAKDTGKPRALNTPYAVFTSIGDFTTAFKRFMKSGNGTALLHQLISANSLASTWREIHALKWPANATETDYPAVLLDRMEEAYRSKLATKAASERKSAGTQQAPQVVKDAAKLQGMALHHAAKSFADGRQAIGYLVRRLG